MKPPVLELTKRQASVVEFLTAYMRDNGYPPTIREIGDHMKIRSTNGVNDHLKAIEKKGYIERLSSKSRAIRPLYMPNKQPFEEWLMEQKDFVQTERFGLQSIHHIPLVGQIAAGNPILAEENHEETLCVGSSLLSRADDVFGLKVTGDSMINDGIFDGDTIFVRKGNVASNGAIVAVLIDNEATVKRFYHEGGRVRLQPANDAMEPIYLSPEEARKSVVMGVVVGLFREL